MRRIYLGLAILALASMTGSAAQAAVYYPWCAVYGGKRGGDVRNCGFVSWSQCRATVIGTGGICQPDPQYFARCRNCGDPYSETAVRQPISAP
jgi:hypothetical protein